MRDLPLQSLYHPHVHLERTECHSRFTEEREEYGLLCNFGLLQYEIRYKHVDTKVNPTLKGKPPANTDFTYL